VFDKTARENGTLRPPAGVDDFHDCNTLRGNIDEVEYSRIDTIIVGSEACELIKQYKEDINKQNSRVLCGFKIGDIYADPFKTTQGENRAVIKGRLLAINWIKIDGKMVYKAEKPQAEAQKQEISATEKTPILPNKTVIECPFSEQFRKNGSLGEGAELSCICIRH